MQSNNDTTRVDVENRKEVIRTASYSLLLQLARFTWGDIQARRITPDEFAELIAMLGAKLGFYTESELKVATEEYFAAEEKE